MVMFMLSTLITALLANISANAAKILSRFAIKSHELSCEPAQIRTLHIQFYALAHHVEILFFKT